MDKFLDWFFRNLMRFIVLTPLLAVMLLLLMCQGHAVHPENEEVFQQALDSLDRKAGFDLGSFAVKWGEVEGVDRVYCGNTTSIIWINPGFDWYYAIEFAIAHGIGHCYGLEDNAGGIPVMTGNFYYTLIDYPAYRDEWLENLFLNIQ
jgi:hypothetical protein